jgi:hypothetical protein
VNKYNFEKGTSIEIIMPEDYQVIVKGGEEKVSLIYSRISNSSYKINNWTVRVLKNEKEKTYKCSINKLIKPEETSEIYIQIRSLGKEPITEMPKLLYWRKNRLIDEKQSVTIAYNSSVIHINNNELIEIVEDQEDDEYSESVKMNVGMATKHSFGSDSDLQNAKERLLRLGENIKKMNTEIEQINERIRMAEVEYRKTEKELIRKKEELKQKIADLQLLKDNGEVDIETLSKEFEDRIAELKEHNEDTKFAINKLRTVRKFEDEFDAVEGQIKALDDLLISFLQEASKESKDVASAIFNNNGKLIR